jgi:pSer/pThr/pTyr-binding forkhead associated (FHA) protein
MTVIWEFKVSDPQTKESRKSSITKNTVLIGRGKESDLRLDSSQVSKRHLCLTYSDSRIYVEDLGSSNGTYIYKKGEWKRVAQKVRARGPIMLNAGKALNIVVKARVALDTAEPTPEEVADAIKGLDASRFAGMEIDSSFVESIDEVETVEAIMVLDLCSSSEMASTNEKMAFHTKRKLKDICERAFAVHSARFVKSTGDGFLATFMNPYSAFLAAQRIFQDLKQRNERSSNPPIHIRMALHHGHTYVIDDENNDIHGNDVNAAFRIEGLVESAFGSPEEKIPETDRLLCSAEYRSVLMDGRYPLESAHFARIGMANLKGIKDEKEIYLVSTP